MGDDELTCTSARFCEGEEQLNGIDAWHRACRAVGEEMQAVSSRVTRESRLDLARRLDVLRRQQASLLERSAVRLRPRSGGPDPVRCVVAHAHEWSRARITHELEAVGVDVVLSVTNAADAVGACLAEQPDVAFLGDRLTMMSALEAVRDLRRFVPASRVVAQARTSLDVDGLSDAGACGVLLPRASPAEVAAQVLSVTRRVPAATAATDLSRLV